MVFGQRYICARRLCENVSWLQERLDLNDTEDVRRLLTRGGSVLAFSVETLDARISWFEKEFRLPSDKVGKVILKSPQVLNYPSSVVTTKTEWLQSKLGLDDAGLRKMVCNQPSIICLSTEKNLGPKLDFYTKVLGKEEARIMNSNNPVCLMLSLEKRIKPRVAEALDLGISLDAKSLGSIVSYTEDKWEDRKNRVRSKQ